jgi:hypothetical protein
MLRVELAKPFVSLAVNRFSILDRKAMKLFNRDNDVRDAAAALLIEKYENDAKVVFGADDEPSGLIAFFQWLINNQDAIKAFIEMIMSLFNSVESKNEKEYVL